MQLHLEDDLPLASAHRLALDVEAAIRARYPGADITIHQDPVSLGAESQEEDLDPDIRVALAGHRVPAVRPRQPTISRETA